MKKAFLWLAIAGLMFGCQQQQPASDSEADPMPEADAEPTIEGAWEMTSRVNNDGEDLSLHKSIIIYADGFYSVEIATEDRPSWPDLAEGEERADEDKVNAYDGLISNSGRYRIEGDSIIHDIIVAKWPNFMNDFPRSAVAYSLDGDQLSTTGFQGTATYRRME